MIIHCGPVKFNERQTTIQIVFSFFQSVLNNHNKIAIESSMPVDSLFGSSSMDYRGC